ncbi:hypothetical protein BOTNAR_0091g00290 [Botryotinia narcissicola]|uniref:Uncharacterized protein n=1 Tax=Botryotinia narcissicola TaxID=278944 RepID=A0A4Z1IS11_9HELO|nr:hypothetical protein BOTNAR_0091g00290 [Botryotinia narcissicola]
MSASVASICPLIDGKYHLISRITLGQPVLYLSVVEGRVIITPETPTVWFFAYQSERGSYRIWQDGTENVLDSTKDQYSPTLVFKHHGENWQQWAARFQIDATRAPADPQRVTGLTLTPLSFPQGLLTMEHGSVRVLPARPHGENIEPSQLWYAIPV